MEKKQTERRIGHLAELENLRSLWNLICSEIIKLDNEVYYIVYRHRTNWAPLPTDRSRPPAEFVFFEDRELSLPDVEPNKETEAEREERWRRTINKCRKRDFTTPEIKLKCCRVNFNKF